MSTKKVPKNRKSAPYRAAKPRWEWLWKETWGHRELLVWLFFKVAHHLQQLFGG